jgi:hypothetical protein
VQAAPVVVQAAPIVVQQPVVVRQPVIVQQQPVVQQYVVNQGPVYSGPALTDYRYGTYYAPRAVGPMSNSAKILNRVSRLTRYCPFSMRERSGCWMPILEESSVWVNLRSLRSWRILLPTIWTCRGVARREERFGVGLLAMGLGSGSRRILGGDYCNSDYVRAPS